MFEKPRYIQNSFNIAFRSQVEIQNKTDEFEDILKNYYNKFMSDKSKPDLRHSRKELVFVSKHEFGKINISQRRIALNVNYPEDYQNDFQKDKKFILERTPLLFELLNVIGEMKLQSCGLVTHVLISSDANINTIIYHIHNIFLKNSNSADLSEVQLKTTKVISDQFLSSITLRNYRIDKSQRKTQPFSNSNVIKLGVAIDGDYKYIFDMQKTFPSVLDLTNGIVNGGFAEVNKMITRLPIKTKEWEEQRRERVIAVEGKYSFVPTNSEEFAESKHQEILLEK